jgi:hypothetical protein
MSIGISSLGRRQSIGSHSQISSSTGKNASKSKKYESRKKLKSDTMTEESQGSTEDYCRFLDLTLFKVKPCNIDSNSHNLKRCPYYHD